jgi:hypothetical protein
MHRVMFKEGVSVGSKGLSPFEKGRYLVGVMPVARSCESVKIVIDFLACDGLHFALVLEGVFWMSLNV